MKRFLVTGGILLVFLIGLSVLLYPYVADYFNSRNQSRVVTQYYKDLGTLTEQDFSDLFDSAKAYNDSLNSKPNRFVLSDEDLAEYNTLLNPFGNEIMGTLRIDVIGVNLPIYHGTSEGVLQVGAGHLEGSSLPIGGLGTHSVITGHRGLPSATLLTKLDRVVIGDTFTLNILGQVLTYQVDQILVVLPNEMEALAIDPNQDYCTLITCTPYGINSHRMLVRGHRVTNIAAPDTGASQHIQVQADAGAVNNMTIAALIFIPVFIIVAVYLGVNIKRIRRRTRQ